MGTPITAGLLASGGINTDETGWSEAKLSIPLKGPKASGSLSIVAGRGDGRWVYDFAGRALCVSESADGGAAVGGGTGDRRQRRDRTVFWDLASE